MNFNRVWVKHFLATFILAFGIALLSGRIIFEVIDKDIFWKAFINSFVLAFFIQFFLKQKDKTSEP